MSKIGKKPILVPEGVTVSFDDTLVTVSWPKWTLTYTHDPVITISEKENELHLDLKNLEKKNIRGLTRTLIDNMIVWVVSWYEKKLLVIWVGYGADMKWNKLELKLWLSHPVSYDVPEGIDMSVEKDPKGNAIVTITGIHKQLVWQTAAQVKSFRKPDAYKGKGIRYMDEIIKLKPGKAAKK